MNVKEKMSEDEENLIGRRRSKEPEYADYGDPDISKWAEHAEYMRKSANERYRRFLQKQLVRQPV